MTESNYTNEIIELSTKLGHAAKNAMSISIDDSPSTARQMIGKFGKHRLYRYYAPERTVHTPVLLVYALVNRPNILDLETERSLIKQLIERGIQPYLLEWGRVNNDDEFIDLADYAIDNLGNAIDTVLQNDGVNQLSLAGVCQGGVMSLIHTAARGEKIKSLITMVTPVDFHCPSFDLARLIRNVNITELTSDLGNVSGQIIKQLFLSLNPIKLGALKSLDMLDYAEDVTKMQTFLRMEQWINDSPDQAAVAFQEFCDLFFMNNSFITKNLIMRNEHIDLCDIRVPILNIFARNDHIVPIESASALKALVPNAKYQELEIDAGHIGLFVTKKALMQTSTAIQKWLLLNES